MPCILERYSKEYSSKFSYRSEAEDIINFSKLNPSIKNIKLIGSRNTTFNRDFLNKLNEHFVIKNAETIVHTKFDGLEFSDLLLNESSYNDYSSLDRSLFFVNNKAYGKEDDSTNEHKRRDLNYVPIILQNLKFVKKEIMILAFINYLQKIMKQ